MSATVFYVAPDARVEWIPGDATPFLWSLCPGCGRLANDLKRRIYFPPDPKKTCPTPDCPGAGGVRPLTVAQAERLAEQLAPPPEPISAVTAAERVKVRRAARVAASKAAP